MGSPAVPGRNAALLPYVPGGPDTPDDADLGMDDEDSAPAIPRSS